MSAPSSGRPPVALPRIPGAWERSRSPLARGAAYRLACSSGIASAFSAAHRIEPWIGRRLLRPMLADLATTGTWQYNRQADMYRLMAYAPGQSEESLCHAFLLTRKGQAVHHYTTTHTDAACTEPAPPAPQGQTWLADLHAHARPPAGTTSPWRAVLRTSTTLPVRISVNALDSIARRTTGTRLDAGSVTPAYTFAAAVVRESFADLLPTACGHYYLHDGNGLTLALVIDPECAPKPVITHWRNMPGPAAPRGVRPLRRIPSGRRSGRATPGAGRG